ncbi:MAG: hypothetical protein QW277_03765 [Methanothermobacter sp.]
MRICLVGLGAVGQGFLRAARFKGEYLKKRYGLELTFTGIADSSGAIYDENGLDIAEILRHKKTDGVGRHPMGVEGMSGLELQGGGKTVCIQGVVGFGTVYGFASHN